MMARHMTSLMPCMKRMVGPVLLVNILILNLLIFFAISSIVQIGRTVHDVTSAQNVIDKMDTYPWIRSLIAGGKDGGFVKLQEQTLERLFVVSYPITNQKGISNGSLISWPGIDVSHSREASYLYRRILSRRPFPYARLIVDIGANDGIMSSNSYNFIQWGWDALLIEPQPDQLVLARKNTMRYVDPYRDGRQRVEYIQAVIGDEDQIVDMALSADAVHMESHIMMPGREGMRQGEKLLKVKSMTVKTFAKLYNVPRYFGILSIDAEGVGDKILHQWIDQGFRPAYIIYEALHNMESFIQTMEFMRGARYRCIIKKGWNHIFEFTDRISMS